MSNVIAFSRPEQADPHIEGNARCLQCKHEWAAVAPVGTTGFECPSCGTYKGVFKGLCEPEEGASMWTCNCGCSALYATPNALRCMMCGDVQKPFD